MGYPWIDTRTLSLICLIKLVRMRPLMTLLHGGFLLYISCTTVKVLSTDTCCQAISFSRRQSNYLHDLLSFGPTKCAIFSYTPSFRVMNVTQRTWLSVKNKTCQVLVRPHTTCVTLLHNFLPWYISLHHYIRPNICKITTGAREEQCPTRCSIAGNINDGLG